MAAYSGCRWPAEVPPGVAAAPSVTAAAQSPPPEEPQPAEDPSPQVVEPSQDPVTPPPADRPTDEPLQPTAAWDELLEQVRESLAQGDIEKTRQGLARLEVFASRLTAEQTEQLTSARAELARQLGDRELHAAVERLASQHRDEVLAAQERIFERADAALPLLGEAVQQDDPLLVRGALEMLRLLQRAEATLPMMVDVLRRPQQQANWPDAVREIRLTAAPGTGEPLLQLAISSELPQQRAMALGALARVVDPPPQTVVALLPLILQDSAELPAALEAAQHALRVHHQYGLLWGRGLPVELSAGQVEQLAALPGRLEQIIAADDSDPPGEAACAARTLAIALRQIPAEPLPGVKVLAFGSELEDSPAAAVLDGQWNTTESKQMWRHSVKQSGSIVLDLGRPRTVAAVRIWNLNEPGAAHRGWKDVAVHVGSTTAELAAPLTTGMVPQAPGKAEGLDYSTTIGVDFAVGRYVRLQATSLWRADSHAGLTEVQVLGF